jgi:hypothetical protein
MVHDLLCVIPQSLIVRPGELSATPIHSAISPQEPAVASEHNALLIAMCIPAITVICVLC